MRSRKQELPLCIRAWAGLCPCAVRTQPSASRPKGTQTLSVPRVLSLCYWSLRTWDAFAGRAIGKSLHCVPKPTNWGWRTEALHKDSSNPDRLNSFISGQAQLHPGCFLQSHLDSSAWCSTELCSPSPRWGAVLNRATGPAKARAGLMWQPGAQSTARRHLGACANPGLAEVAPSHS